MPTRTRRTLASLAAAALLAAGCGGPFLLLPGGKLDGAASDPPDSWSFLDEIDTVQLETRPSDPYSVNIWVTRVDESIYLHAGADPGSWVEHIEANPNVRLGVEGAVYDLTAARVDTQDEFDRFAEAYDEKFGLRPRNEDVTEAYLFRLAAR
jgi:hypothetical protein